MLRTDRESEREESGRLDGAAKTSGVLEEWLRIHRKR